MGVTKMSSLKKLLNSYYPTTSELGGRAEPELRAMQAALHALIKRNRTHYWIVAGMIGVVFVFAVVISVMYIEKPEHAAAIFGAIGISIPMAVGKMMQLGKETALTEVFIVLAGDLG